MDGYVIMLDQQTLIQIAIQLVNTCILCFALSKLLYKPVTQFLNARKERIAQQIDDAEERLRAAEALKAEYENKLKNIESEKNYILERREHRQIKTASRSLLRQRMKLRLFTTEP